MTTLLQHVLEKGVDLIAFQVTTHVTIIMVPYLQRDNISIVFKWKLTKIQHKWRTLYSLEEVFEYCTFYLSSLSMSYFLLLFIVTFYTDPMTWKNVVLIDIVLVSGKV